LRLFGWSLVIILGGLRGGGALGIGKGQPANGHKVRKGEPSLMIEIEHLETLQGGSSKFLG
jgi:hypothetical protein